MMVALMGSQLATMMADTLVVMLVPSSVVVLAAPKVEPRDMLLAELMAE